MNELIFEVFCDYLSVVLVLVSGLLDLWLRDISSETGAPVLPCGRSCRYKPINHHRLCLCVCVCVCVCVCAHISHLSGNTSRSGWSLGDDSIAGHVDVQLKSVQNLFCLVSIGMVVW